MSNKSACTASRWITSMLIVACLSTIWTPAVLAQSDLPWRAEYFDNPALTGQPILERNESGISYDWQGGAPDAGLPADGFSAQWTAYLLFEPGNYTFMTTTDGGVALWVDAQLLIGQWEATVLALYKQQVALDAGYHIVRLEYRHHSGNAAARLWWEQQPGEGAGSQVSAASSANPEPPAETVAAPATLTAAPAPTIRWTQNQVRRWGGPEESWYENSHGFKGELFPEVGEGEPHDATTVH